MQQQAGPRFEIGDAVSTGWKKFWPNILPMLVFALIVWLVNAIVQLPQNDDASGVTRFVFNVIGWVIGQLIAIGWIKLALDIVDGVRPSANAILERFSLFIPYVVAAVIFSVMVSLGLILLIVPGIILAIVFGFYGFHIIDTSEKNPIEALRRSAQITKGSRLQLFLLGLVLIGINILGLLVLIVGVLFTSGISLLAIAYVYRRLSSSSLRPAFDESPGEEAV